MTYLTVGILLAEEPNRGPDYGKASPVGLLVVVLLLIGVFALVRSMNRQLKKVPASFDAAADGASPTADAPAAEPPAAPEPAGPPAPGAPEPDEAPPGRDG